MDVLQNHAWVMQKSDPNDSIHWYFGTNGLCVSTVATTGLFTLMFYELASNQEVKGTISSVNRHYYGLPSKSVAELMSFEQGLNNTNLHVSCTRLASRCASFEMKPIPSSVPVVSFGRPAISGRPNHYDFVVQCGNDVGYVLFRDVTGFFTLGWLLSSTISVDHSGNTLTISNDFVEVNGIYTRL